MVGVVSELHTEWSRALSTTHELLFSYLLEYDTYTYVCRYVSRTRLSCALLWRWCLLLNHVDHNTGNNIAHSSIAYLDIIILTNSS